MEVFWVVVPSSILAVHDVLEEHTASIIRAEVKRFRKEVDGLYRFRRMIGTGGLANQRYGIKQADVAVSRPKGESGAGSDTQTEIGLLKVSERKLRWKGNLVFEKNFLPSFQHGVRRENPPSLLWY
jgi:hypothetical protein